MPRNSQRDGVRVPDYRHGAIVRHRNACDTAEHYGVVVGLRINDLGELVLLVAWAGGDTSSIHPSNVEYVE